MEYLQAQCSLKFEPVPKIRKALIVLEDLFEEKYLPPQTMPIPDEFAADAPRIIFMSKGGHSQIILSQLSIDFIVNFDSNFLHDYSKCESYIRERIDLLIKSLKAIHVDKIFFLGIIFNTAINTKGLSPIQYMQNKITNYNSSSEDVYDILSKVAFIKDNKYFINKQFSNYRKYQERLNLTLNDISHPQKESLSEGVNFLVDINNKYHYSNNGNIFSTDDCFKEKEIILELIKNEICEVEK